MTVPICWFISSGEITTPGRVFRISCPWVGSSRHQVDLKAGNYHSHSVVSHWVADRDASSRSASSPCSRIWRKASSQPPRARVAGRMTRWSWRGSSSTSSLNRYCSKRTFGMRMPRELPIRIKSSFHGKPPSRRSNYNVNTRKDRSCQIIPRPNPPSASWLCTPWPTVSVFSIPEPNGLRKSHAFVWCDVLGKIRNSCTSGCWQPGFEKDG